MVKKKDQPKKRIHNIKVELKDNENYCIVNKRSSVLVFTESPNDPSKTNVELILPNEKDLGDMEVSNSINLATSLTIKLKTEPNFGSDLLCWFADYIQKQALIESTN